MKSVCETGIVREVRGDMVIVRLVGEPGCRKCGLKELGLCKTGGAGMDIEARCTIAVKPGQRVTVIRGGRSYSDGGFMVYGLPVAGLVLGALLGRAFGPSLGLADDAAAVTGGFLCLLLAALPIRAWSRKQEASRRFLPTVRALDPWYDRGKP